MTWLLIIQVLTTGQRIALPQPSQAQCLADLQQVHAGILRTVILADGLRVPVARGIECVSQEEYEARRGSAT
jgi:hypothetical protein